MYKALFNVKVSAAEHINTLRKKWLNSKDIWQGLSLEDYINQAKLEK